MHGTTWGYVAPVPMYLTTGRGETAYRLDKDGVASLVRRMGCYVADSISGNLPFGYGFASSTVLALLHLDRQLTSGDLKHVVRVLDWIQHGFEPSGVDYVAVRAQTPGFFVQGRWRSAPPCPLPTVFCGVSPGPERAPGSTRNLVSKIIRFLAPIAERMTSQLDSYGRVSMDDLLAYSRILYESEVYSEEQSALIGKAISSGIPAKGIGGLYNKAVVLTGDVEASLSLISSFVGAAVLGTDVPVSADEFSAVPGVD
jgi:hypothetical protein